MINRIIKYFMVGLGIVILFLSLTVFFQYKKLQYNRLFSTVDTEVQLELNKLGLPVKEKEIKQQGIFPPHPVAEVEIQIPQSFPPDNLLADLKQRFESSGIQVLSLEKENLKKTYNIHVGIGRERVLTHKLFLSLKKAKVALLIDDFGYANDAGLLDAFFKDLPFSFTISIIPGTRFGKEIAAIAHQERKQIIVHMPMEPEKDFNNQYRWIILNGMSPEKIKKQVKGAIESVPYAQGLNNHMGSLVTSKRKLMEPVLELLKEKGMFFVDSKTSSFSIGYSLAKDLGVKSTFNCVFLDNKRNEAYIENQFKKLIRRALHRGWVLGLGHSNMRTALTLRKMVKNCDDRRISFVPVSEILN